jgi:AcrR family transcriptional regulator
MCGAFIQRYKFYSVAGCKRADSSRTELQSAVQRSSEQHAIEEELTTAKARREANILVAARLLIADKGYDGVTMRLLAEKSGVALKTLYRKFDSKEHLLSVAVEDLYQSVYMEIAENSGGQGLDALFSIVDAVAAATVKFESYSRHVVLLTLRQPRNSKIREIRQSAYSQALQEIADQGGFEDGIDLDQITEVVMRAVRSVTLEWARLSLDSEQLSDAYRLQVALCLAGISVGETQERLKDIIRAQMQ